MDGKKLQVESCFVGAAVLTGAKVVKGVSKAKGLRRTNSEMWKQN